MTYDAVMKIVIEHSGAYGMGVDHARTMVRGASHVALVSHPKEAAGRVEEAACAA